LQRYSVGQGFVHAKTEDRLDQQRHQKIKFRRDEIADLGAMPSACTVPPLGKARFRRGRRLLLRTVLALACLFVVVAAAVYAIGVSGIGSERLRPVAERAIEKIAGMDVDIALGPARITLDAANFLALEVDDVKLATTDGTPMVEAGSVRFGVRLLPLLSGKVRLTSARLSDARIVASALPAGGGGWSAALRDGDGLLDPDRLVEAAFGAVHQMLDAVRLDSLRRIGLRNVDIVLPESGEVKLLRVGSAVMAETGLGRIELSANVEADGRSIDVTASAEREPGSRRIAALRANADIAGPETDGKASAGVTFGKLSLRLAGVEGKTDETSRLTASLSLAGVVVDLGARGLLPADVNVDATLAAGTNKLAVDRLHVRSGRSVFDFEGSIGPKPREAGSPEEPSYRYDLVSDGSTLAPDDSPEPALRFLARVAGTYRTGSRKLIADTIALRSGPAGEAMGSATVAFVAGEAPGVSLAIGVHDMPVSHVKQLWPWFSAHSARSWVLNNLFGGRVVDGSVQYRVAPGRAGNGVPLSGDEVFGRFAIEGSRFDTAGRIPPVRDAVGTVDFRGNDVEITLSSGTVYMPSGRTVAASNGKLTVDNANVSPVIGALDIDVAGEAPAIAELASYEPINAMRHVGILPDELSGTVRGNVKADIPLQSGVDTDSLNWLVALDYEDLALAKPVDGQVVTQADGSITVDPKKALISARGRLNGIPAEIDLVEPLEPDGPPRSRKVALVIDDKTREAFMPGLSTLLSGTIKVAVDRGEDGSQDVSADLTAAKLTIPWAGWSKGAGVPADVSFTMTENGTSRTLSKFDLDGKSFAVDGTVVLNGGSLSSASFDRVQLNRGDDVAVSVKRSAKGYAVSIRGDALDARALIKQFTADTDTATKTAGSSAISVSADVKSLTGFHDERLADLKLDYSAAGSKVDGLKVSATASSGAAVSIANTTANGRRSMTMKSADAGAILRFLDIYQHMQGGALTLALDGDSNGPVRGSVDARNFAVVDEPKLASIVSTKPAGSSRSLNEAVKADIDTSRVPFERAYAEIEKGRGYLNLANGVLRGPSIGTTFQGTLYDQDNNMDVTGTFMPIYGLNRIFGELPIVGVLLGNGRDRGLIGVTFRLKGNANKPDLSVNPLSVIAPGIFRSIFEFH
jgi:hypothetical protein